MDGLITHTILKNHYAFTNAHGNMSTLLRVHTIKSNQSLSHLNISVTDNHKVTNNHCSVSLTHYLQDWKTG